MSASLRFLPAFSTSLCGQLRLREPRRQAVTGEGGGGDARRARPAQRPVARSGAKPPPAAPHHLARHRTGKLRDPTCSWECPRQPVGPAKRLSRFLLPRRNESLALLSSCVSEGQAVLHLPRQETPKHIRRLLQGQVPVHLQNGKSSKAAQKQIT